MAANKLSRICFAVCARKTVVQPKCGDKELAPSGIGVRFAPQRVKLAATDVTPPRRIHRVASPTALVPLDFVTQSKNVAIERGKLMSSGLGSSGGRIQLSLQCAVHAPTFVDGECN